MCHCRRGREEGAGSGHWNKNNTLLRSSIYSQQDGSLVVLQTPANNFHLSSYKSTSSYSTRYRRYESKTALPPWSFEPKIFRFKKKFGRIV